MLRLCFLPKEGVSEYALMFHDLGIGSWSRVEGTRGSKWWRETTLGSLSVTKTVGNFSVFYVRLMKKILGNCESGKMYLSGAVCFLLKQTKN